MYTGTCAQCGKTYERKRPIRGTTCSPSCTAKLYRSKPDDERICLGCGIIFSVRPSSKIRYCCIQCFNRRKDAKLGRQLAKSWIQQCVNCGQDFKRSAGQLKRKYCSRQCAIRGRGHQLHTQEIKECLECGQDFIAAKNKHRFCSRKCSRRNYGKTKRQSYRDQDIWPNSREAKAVLLIKHCCCQICGWKEVPEVLELHHKDRNHRNNSQSNLMLLCPNCHTIEHWKTGTGQFKKSSLSPSNIPISSL